MYGGQCFGGYTDSMMKLAVATVQRGIRLHFCAISNESHIDRARIVCADEFLRSGMTHMMFIDGDIQFRAQDVLELLDLADPASDRDILCGFYPKKAINWKLIAQAVKNGLADEDPNILEQFV